jgi:hypothetical protein
MKFRISIWFTMLLSTLNAQYYAPKCPVDTNTIFEIGLKIFQSYNSDNKIITRTTLEYAIPSFDNPESFIHEESKERCLPYSLMHHKGKLYIIDSVAYYNESEGEWKVDFEKTKKILLRDFRIRSLKIEINNETTEAVDLNKIDLLQELKLPITILGISFTYSVPKKTRLRIKKWEFIENPEDLHSVYIQIPIDQRKKQILKHLNRFRNLQKIELYHPLVKK